MQPNTQQDLTTVFHHPRSSSAKLPRSVSVTHYKTTTYVQTGDPSELRGPLPTVRGPRVQGWGAAKFQKDRHEARDTEERMNPAQLENIELRLAAVRNRATSDDRRRWLADAPEDIESLIHAVKSLSDERDALRRDLERERSVARGVADERSKAILELSRLKASLATLREVLQ